MTNSKLALHSLGHAALVVLYVVLVPNLMQYLSPRIAIEHTAWGPAGMLLLFVVSVALMGVLIFGRPILLYIDGQKREAVKFLGYTLGWLVLAGLLILAYLTTVPPVTPLPVD